MTRLSDVERAERKMVRGRLEGMDDAKLKRLATGAGVDCSQSRLRIVNSMMACYKRTWGCS